MNRPPEKELRILTLLKLDAMRLFDRIKHREIEYMSIFSQRRTREHFPEVFKNRYDDTSISDLMNCSDEVIVILDKFYSKVDELRWFLGQTQEMPGAVATSVTHYISELEKLHETLQLHINAELGLFKNEDSTEMIEIPPEIEP